MKLKILMVFIGLASAGVVFGAATSVSDLVNVDTYLNTLNGGVFDHVSWQHANPFISQGIGDYALTLANSGILGAELVVNASEILWTGDPTSLVNDFLFVQFIDANGGIYEINPVVNGVNSLVIDPADLSLMHDVSATLWLTIANANDFPDDAYIGASELIVRYESDLVVGGAGTQPIPAPGALVLGGLGWAVVSVLRRRRAL
ncbi:MAG: hypothetical protein JW828_16915 [Sedimentisphaerales bacterium]|nr:hypothetical protein [Sedimentisphaerales bacterium]